MAVLKEVGKDLARSQQPLPLLSSIILGDRVAL